MNGNMATTWKTQAVNSGISPTTFAYFHPIEPWWQTIKTAITKDLPQYNFRVPRRRRFSNIVNTLLLAALNMHRIIASYMAHNHYQWQTPKATRLCRGR